jgi:hypothetical protein
VSCKKLFLILLIIFFTIISFGYQIRKNSVTLIFSLIWDVHGNAKPKIVIYSLGEAHGQWTEEDGRDEPEHPAHVRGRVSGHAAPASRQDLHVQVAVEARSARVHVDPHSASPQKDRNDQTQKIA